MLAARSGPCCAVTAVVITVMSLLAGMFWIICLTRAASCHCQRPLLNYYSNILFEEQLLEGLSNWMDRLFEGTTVRYHINYWPDWPGK